LNKCQILAKEFCAWTQQVQAEHWQRYCAAQSRQGVLELPLHTPRSWVCSVFHANFPSPSLILRITGRMSASIPELHLWVASLFLLQQFDSSGQACAPAGRKRSLLGFFLFVCFGLVWFWRVIFNYKRGGPDQVTSPVNLRSPQ
jgi:hypothetical protein